MITLRRVLLPGTSSYTTRAIPHPPRYTTVHPLVYTAAPVLHSTRCVYSNGALGSKAQKSLGGREPGITLRRVCLGTAEPVNNVVYVNVQERMKDWIARG